MIPLKHNYVEDETNDLMYLGDTLSVVVFFLDKVKLNRDPTTISRSSIFKFM